MAVSEEYINYLMEQLKPVGEINSRKMFGGVGIFKQGKMFGMLNSKNTFLLKVDESNIQDYKSRGMSPFTHEKNKNSKMPYYEVPVEVIEDTEQLKIWAEKSIKIAIPSSEL